MNTKLIDHLNDQNFDEKILKKDLALVDFWAEWCGPCKILSPILEEISKEYLKYLTIFKINIDENSLTAPKYNIRSIPTLILFKKGILIETKVGLLSKKEIKDFLNKHLN